MTVHTFGDSITAGTGASAPEKRYVALLGAMLGEVTANHGVSTHMVFDQYDSVVSTLMSAGDQATIFLGTNDETKYDADVTKRGYFIDGMRAEALRLGAQWTPATPAYVTFTGSWSNGYAWSTYGAWQAGSKATFTVTGTQVAIGTILQYQNTSSFKVTIDGVDKGTFATGGDGRTILGRAYGPRALMFTGLSAGTHTVTIEVVSNATNQMVYLQWFSACAPKNKICIINIPHATSYPSGGSSANVDAYNAAIAAFVAELTGCGLDVVVADVCSALTSADMADAVHPNDAGHQKIANLTYAALTGGSPEYTYTPVSVVKRSDGLYFIEGGGPQIAVI